MDTICPFADFRPITENISPNPRRPIRGLTAHVQVGMGSLFGFFNTRKPKGKGGSADFWCSKQGELEQYTDLGATEPWSQGSGSAAFVSVEFEGFPEEPMTDAQLDTGGRLLAWLITEGYQIPLEVHDGKHDPGLVPHFAWFDENYHTCPQGPNFEGPRWPQYSTIAAIASRLLTGSTTPVTKHRRDTVHVSKHPSGRIDTLVVGADGQVWHSYGNTVDVAVKATFENLGGQAVSVTGDWSGDSYVVAAHAPDNRLFYKVWNGKAWGGWAPHPNAVLLAG